MVGMKSTSMRTTGSPTPRYALAVSMFFSLDASDRMFITLTEETVSSGRRRAKGSWLGFGLEFGLLVRVTARARARARAAVPSAA